MSDREADERRSPAERAAALDAKLVRQYGERRAIAELTTRKLNITEEKAWELAALTCKLGGDQGGYRGPAEQTMVFITFGEVTLKKATASRRSRPRRR